MSDEKNLPVPEDQELENSNLENAAVPEETDDIVSVVRKRGNNEFFRQMMDRNFLDYASYVIGSRAIPNVDDGLKPDRKSVV